VILAAVDTKGNSFLIALAALCIVCGLFGLVMHAKKQNREAAKEPELPRRQNIYREYSCRIEPDLLERLQKLGHSVKEQLEGRTAGYDWTNYQRHSAGAERLMQEGDLLASFREECRALHDLALWFNKHRPREEGFKPKWENVET
jgi:hypothetical protein